MERFDFFNDNGHVISALVHVHHTCTICACISGCEVNVKQYILYLNEKQYHQQNFIHVAMILINIILESPSSYLRSFDSTGRHYAARGHGLFLAPAVQHMQTTTQIFHVPKCSQRARDISGGQPASHTGSCRGWPRKGRTPDLR